MGCLGIGGDMSQNSPEPIRHLAQARNIFWPVSENERENVLSPQQNLIDHLADGRWRLRIAGDTF
jgi:hypothetical protein